MRRSRVGSLILRAHYRPTPRRCRSRLERRPGPDRPQKFSHLISKEKIMSQRDSAVTAKRLKLYAALVLLLACAAAGLYARGREQQTPAAQARPVAQATPAPAQPPFPNANPNYIPPPSVYSGPLFVLSQDYPAQMPNDLPAFLTTDFKGDWKNYMLRVRDYCFEGNTDVDFRVEHNNKRHWFHIPWQDYGPQGREGIHGLTKEASVQVQQLASSQTYSGGQTYAVGFFNDYAG